MITTPENHFLGALVLVVILGCGGSSGPETSRVPQVLVTRITPAPSGTPAIASRRQSVELEFEVANTGDTILQTIAPVTACSCQSKSSLPQQLRPREKGRLKLIVTAPERGRMQREIELRDQFQRKVGTIPIDIEVPVHPPEFVQSLHEIDVLTSSLNETQHEVFLNTIEHRETEPWIEGVVETDGQGFKLVDFLRNDKFGDDPRLVFRRYRLTFDFPAATVGTQRHQAQLAFSLDEPPEKHLRILTRTPPPARFIPAEVRIENHQAPKTSAATIAHTRLLVIPSSPNHTVTLQRFDSEYLAIESEDSLPSVPAFRISQRLPVDSDLQTEVVFRIADAVDMPVTVWLTKTEK